MNVVELTVDKERAPGTHHDSRDRFRSYVWGFALSCILTAGSFVASASHQVWAPSLPVLLAVLAVSQMGVHLVFFLHISSAPDSANNILSLAFGVFVVALMVFGSIIIVRNLNDNMMPMPMKMDQISSMEHLDRQR